MMNSFYMYWTTDDKGNMTPRYVEDITPVNGLSVPYHSQWETDAQKFKSDCGPANIEMVGEFYNGPSNITTNDIMQWITKGVNRNTSAVELINAARHFYDIKLVKIYNVTWDDLKAAIAKGDPIIVLVHYGSFIMRLDRNFTGGHWMTVKGFDTIDYQGTNIERIILHDPNWWGDYKSQGADIPVIKKHFMNMWGTCHIDGNPNYMAIIKE